MTENEKIFHLFEFWKKTMGKTRRTILDAKRMRKIKWAISHYEIEDLEMAILGCSKSEYNMGNNENNVVYDDIELIFRNASNIERFIQNYEKQGINFEEKKNYDFWKKIDEMKLEP